MRACVTLSRSDGRTWVLGHGDLVGRLWTAALPLEDPRVSEAHAMVSLRDGRLQLLALRRRFAVGGKLVSKVTLEPGLVIELAPDVALTVVDLALPEAVLAIEGDGLSRQALLGVSSLFTKPRPSLVPGYEADAEAWIWTDGESWTLRVPGRPEARLIEGAEWQVGQRTFRAVLVPLSSSSQNATRVEGGLERPLRLVSWYESVEIVRAGEPTITIGGMPGRLLGELISIGGSAPWDAVARELWPKLPEENLRKSWDVTLSRLRAKLRSAGIRVDLVKPDGSGQVLLSLGEHDEIEDHA